MDSKLVRMTKGTDALRLGSHSTPNLTWKTQSSGCRETQTGALFQATGKAEMESDLLQHRPHLILPQQFDLKSSEAL